MSFRTLKGAGEGIRTLNPIRGAVFETAAYTVPPRRPACSSHSVRDAPAATQASGHAARLVPSGLVAPNDSGRSSDDFWAMRRYLRLPGLVTRRCLAYNSAIPYSPGRPARILEFPVSYDDTQVALLTSAREAETSRDPRATLHISFTWKEARVARCAPSGAPAYTCVTRDENAYAESA